MKPHADPVSHETAQELLPWLSSCAPGEAGSAALLAHVTQCAECQRDLEWQARLRAAKEPDDSAFDADRALARLMPRLGPQAPRVSVPERWRAAAPANGAWLRWTVAAQCALIVVLAGLLARPGPDSGDYRALGSPPLAPGDLVLVFRPDTSEREMRRILQANGARVVDGPSVTGAWVLALPPSQAPGALARLQSEPAVALAQPLAAAGPP